MFGCLTGRRPGRRRAATGAPPSGGYTPRSVQFKAYRNDGLTGAARFSAGLPLAATWLPEAVGVGQVSLWDAAGGTELPCYVERLKGLPWPDGRSGMRGILIQADLTWATANTPVVLTLKIGTPPGLPRLAKATVPATLRNQMGYAVDQGDPRFFAWNNDTYHLIGPTPLLTAPTTAVIVRVAAGTRLQFPAGLTIQPGGGISGPLNSFKYVTVNREGVLAIGGTSGGGPNALGGTFPEEAIGYGGTLAINLSSSAPGPWTAGVDSLLDPNLSFLVKGAGVSVSAPNFMDGYYGNTTFEVPPFVAIPGNVADRMAMGEPIFGRTISQADEKLLPGNMGRWPTIWDNKSSGAINQTIWPTFVGQDAISRGAYEQGRAWIADGWRNGVDDRVYAWTLRGLGCATCWWYWASEITALYGFTGVATPEWSWSITSVGKGLYYLTGDDSWRQFARFYVSGYVQRDGGGNTNYVDSLKNPTAYYMEARVRARVMSGMEVCASLECDPVPNPTPIGTIPPKVINDWIAVGNQCVTDLKTGRSAYDGKTWRANGSCQSVVAGVTVAKAYMDFMCAAALVDWFQNVAQHPDVLGLVRDVVDYHRTTDYHADGNPGYGDQYMTPAADVVNFSCIDGNGLAYINSQDAMGCKSAGFVYARLKAASDPAAATYLAHGDERWAIYWVAKDAIPSAQFYAVDGPYPKSWVESWQDCFEYLAFRLA